MRPQWWIAAVASAVAAAAPAAAQTGNAGDVSGLSTSTAAVAGLGYAPRPAGRRDAPSRVRFDRTDAAERRVAVVLADGDPGAALALAAALAPDDPQRATAFATAALGLTRVPRPNSAVRLRTAITRWNALLSASPSTILRAPPPEWEIVHRALATLARP